MKSYVVGFLFNHKGEVCLIEKNRPEWQKGRLNGIGGHIENGESPTVAMNREFFEEAGACAKWRQFCFMHGTQYETYCFTSRVYQGEPKTMTDERVSWYPVNNLPSNIISNLAWLVPMANHEFIIKADVEHESEIA